MDIGNRIKQLRKDKGLTQSDLATEAKISRSYLADIEANRYNPSLDTLKSIAVALNIELAVIISEDTGINSDVKEKVLQQAEDAYKVDPDMIIQMCRATFLPEEERQKIKEYSALLIEKFLKEKAQKEKSDD